MDVIRSNTKHRRLAGRAAGLAGIGLLVLGLTFALARFGSAAPKVTRSALWIDEVKRGRFTREVRGSGTLVPERSRLIVAATDGTVLNIPFEPGATIKQGQVVLELTNPAVAQQLREAELNLRAGEADLIDLAGRLRSQALGQAAVVAEVHGELMRAGVELRANEALAADGTVPALVVNQSRSRVRELLGRRSIERSRLAMVRRSLTSELAAQKARLAQLAELVSLRRTQMDQLKIIAPLSGILQQVSVQLGKHVDIGAVVAKVADPSKLRAEVRVIETQAKDVQIGQHVQIDTHNGVTAGHVIRIDPAVQNNMVTVVVGLDEQPAAARPDLSVDASIVIDVADQVLWVGRPPMAEPGAHLAIFKLDDAHHARRVAVTLGRTSLNTVEVVSGVTAGDKVILSDTSAWDHFDSIRLE